MRNGEIEKRKILFFSFVGANYSRSSTILNFESPAFSKQFISLPSGTFRQLHTIFKRRSEFKSAEYLVVMSPCHVVTPILKFLTRKIVILDAGWSLTDGQLSRSKKPRDLHKLIKSYITDFVAFHTASKVIVESQNQARRMATLFIVPKKKIEVNFTGLDETAFSSYELASNGIPELDLMLKPIDQGLIVLFRGKVNNESGFEHILEAARILENNVSFILVSGNIDSGLAIPSNTIMLSNLSNLEMSEVYRKSDITLGQLSTHPRLSYTIPHKAFEAGFFAKPYVTSNSGGIRELYGPDCVVLLDNVSGVSIASEINRLKNPETRALLTSKISSRYQEIASQRVINEKFEYLLNNL
jgi:glycosyltransferase involved in cell wall biosynthesis